MRDVMTEIGNALLADPFIREQASGRIKLYEYPATGDVTGPYIVIAPIGPPVSADYGDDEPITEEYLFQIDVWTKNRMLTKELAKRVQKVMRGSGYRLYGGSVDERDKDTGIYRDARRYRGKEYDEEVEAFM